MAHLVARRSLLLGGISLAAVWAVGVVPAVANGLRVLSPLEAAVIDRAAAAYFPDGRLPVRRADVNVVQRVDDYVADGMDAVRRNAFRAVLLGLEWGTLMATGARFTALGEEEARAVLTAWGDPEVLPRRIAIDALKAVLGMAFLSHPAVLDAIGWRASCSGGRV